MTKLAVVLLLSALVLQFSSALDFSYPAQVNQDEEFNIEIISDSDQTSDVKAYVSKDTKEYSEIFYNGVWKSPRNYVPAAFPTETTFTLMAHTTGKTIICIKLRNSDNQKEIEQVCNDIEVLENKEEVVIDEPSEEADEEIKEKDESNVSPRESFEDSLSKEEPAQIKSTDEIEPIKLGSSSSKIDAPSHYSTDGLLRILSYSVFTLFMSFIAVLAFLKKI